MSHDSESLQRASFDAVRELSFLDGVEDRHVRTLVSRSELVRYGEGTIIFSESQPALNCYLIIEGTVVLEICGTTTGCTQIQTVGRGEVLGWSTILGAAELTMTARTLAPTEAIEISGQTIHQMCEQDHEFGYALMRATAVTLSRRLTATRLQLLDVFREGAGM